MDSLIKGNSFAPFPATGVREKLEARADAEGMDVLLAELKTVDPDSANRLHLADRKRIIRALEVYYETGTTITAHNLQTQSIPPRYTPLWFGLDDEKREDLYDRIDRRVIDMVQQGLIQEITGLLAEGIPEKCTAMQAIGYKEFLGALRAEYSMEDAIAQVQQSSRKYAKRQLTWFRRNPSIHWLRRKSGQHTNEILQAARQILRETDK